MRLLLSVEFPIEPFNTLVREGSIGHTLSAILEEIKPEAAYFTERDGKRGGIFIVDLAGPSDVPKFAEPFFLKLNAECKLHIVMTPQDLAKASLESIGKKWG